MKFNNAPRNTNHYVHGVYYILYSNLLTRSIIVILTKIARVVSHIFYLSLPPFVSLFTYSRVPRYYAMTQMFASVATRVH